MIDGIVQSMNDLHQEKRNVLGRHDIDNGRDFWIRRFGELYLNDLGSNGSDCQYRVLGHEFGVGMDYICDILETALTEDVFLCDTARTDVADPDRYLDNLSYIEAVKNRQEWGNSCTLQVIADHFGRRIHVLSSLNGGSLIVVEPASELTSNIPIYIGHYSEVHYVAIEVGYGDSVSSKADRLSKSASLPVPRFSSSSSLHAERKPHDQREVNLVNGLLERRIFDEVFATKVLSDIIGVTESVKWKKDAELTWTMVRDGRNRTQERVFVCIRFAGAYDTAKRPKISDAALHCVSDILRRASLEGYCVAYMFWENFMCSVAAAPLPPVERNSASEGGQRTLMGFHFNQRWSPPNRIFENCGIYVLGPLAFSSSAADAEKARGSLFGLFPAVDYRPPPTPDPTVAAKVSEFIQSLVGSISAMRDEICRAMAIYKPATKDFKVGNSGDMFLAKFNQMRFQKDKIKGKKEWTKEQFLEDLHAFGSEFLSESSSKSKVLKRSRSLVMDPLSNEVLRRYSLELAFVRTVTVLLVSLFVEIKVQDGNLRNQVKSVLESYPLFDFEDAHSPFGWFDASEEVMDSIAVLVNTYRQWIQLAFKFSGADIVTALYHVLCEGEGAGGLGQFYTPHAAVELLFRSVRYQRKVRGQESLRSNDHASYCRSMLDPACGSGGFCVTYLSEVVQELLDMDDDLARNEVSDAERHQMLIRGLTSAVQNIWGFDIDFFSVQLCKMNMIIHAAPLIQKLREPPFQSRLIKTLPKWRIFCVDSLSLFGQTVVLPNVGKNDNNMVEVSKDDASWSPDKKFDFIFGNPPFIQKKGNGAAFIAIRPEKKLKKNETGTPCQQAWLQFFRERKLESKLSGLSLYYYFLLFCGRHLSNDGCIGMVSPPDWVFRYEDTYDAVCRDLTVSSMDFFRPKTLFKSVLSEIILWTGFARSAGLRSPVTVRHISNESHSIKDQEKMSPEELVAIFNNNTFPPLVRYDCSEAAVLKRYLVVIDSVVTSNDPVMLRVLDALPSLAAALSSEKCASLTATNGLKLNPNHVFTLSALAAQRVFGGDFNSMVTRGLLVPICNIKLGAFTYSCSRVVAEYGLLVPLETALNAKGRLRSYLEVASELYWDKKYRVMLESNPQTEVERHLFKKFTTARDGSDPKKKRSTTHRLYPTEKKGIALRKEHTDEKGYVISNQKKPSKAAIVEAAKAKTITWRIGVGQNQSASASTGKVFRCFMLCSDLRLKHPHVEIAGDDAAIAFCVLGFLESKLFNALFRTDTFCCQRNDIFHGKIGFLENIHVPFQSINAPGAQFVDLLVRDILKTKMELGSFARGLAQCFGPVDPEAFASIERLSDSSHDQLQVNRLLLRVALLQFFVDNVIYRIAGAGVATQQAIEATWSPLAPVIQRLEKEKIISREEGLVSGLNPGRAAEVLTLVTTLCNQVKFGRADLLHIPTLQGTDALPSHLAVKFDDKLENAQVEEDENDNDDDGLEEDEDQEEEEEEDNEQKRQK